MDRVLQLDFNPGQGRSERKAPVLPMAEFIEPEEIFENQIYTIKSAARVLRCCEKTIYKLCWAGEMHHKRIGRGIRILGSDLLGFMKEGNLA